MEIQIQNCNNILEGQVDLVEGALNIKYAINGTGKSTIAKAIYAKVAHDDTLMQSLKPYRFLTDEGNNPVVDGVDGLRSVRIFDEAYINQYVYQKDELVKNSFEIFVKTPNYERHLTRIQSLLSDINQSFQDNPELDALIQAFSQFIDGCGKSQTGIAASGSIYKAFGKGNKISHIPDGLEAYSPYLSNTQDANNVKWIKWQSDGKRYLDMADQCPYCSASVEHTRERILKVSDVFDAKAVEHLNKMLSLFEQLAPYFDDPTNEQISYISNNADNMTIQQKNYLHEIKNQASTMLSQLQALKRLGFQSLKDVERISEHLHSYEINLSLYGHFQSELMREKIGIINTSLQTVSTQAGIIQGEVNQQNRLIQRTIEENSGAINDFLACAGYRYAVSIEEAENLGYKMILRSTDCDAPIDTVKDHLSYGERNALALALFMFSALKEDPDLIILDDPISSFDGNKKFALLNLLFLSERCLRNRTVLLLTHDFNTVIDVIYTMPYNFNPHPHGAFLVMRDEILTEREIVKENILSFKQIAITNMNSEIDTLNKAVYLRRLLEIEGEKNEAWHLLSNLFHKREIPIIPENGNNRSMTEEEIFNGLEVIHSYIPDFDYEVEYAKTQQANVLIEIYQSNTCNYEKLQIYRILYNENHEDPVVKKFVNESFHVENDFLFQLNPHEYDTVPQYIIDACDSDIANIYQ